MKKQPFITFITGPSGAGKTTLYESLQADSELAHVSFHDIDEVHPPPVGRGPWRQYRVALLLHNALAELEHGTSTVICGITMPSEVIEQRFYRADQPIHFIAVTPSDEQIRQRLTNRIDDQLAAGHWNESFNADTRITNPAENITLNGVLREAVGSLRHGIVVDSSSLSVGSLCATVKGHLQAIESGTRNV